MKLQLRNDDGLAFMLKYENVAWFEDGVVRILDRRIYPIRVEYVTCTDYRQVAQAIADMVTQSEGPYPTCLMGMALAAWQAKTLSAAEVVPFLTEAAYVLSHARPTTAAKMCRLTDGSLAALKAAIDQGGSGQELVDTAFAYAYDYYISSYAHYSRTAQYLVEKYPDRGTILTQCFPGTIVGTMLREIRRRQKDLKFFCCETRPYYQGARLTASCCQDMGFDTTVICDNMPAYTMKTKGIDLFMCASDVVTCDGHVVNKVGTFQIAMAAKYYGIPVYIVGEPDPAHPDMSRIVIEERDGNQTIASLGQKTVMDGVKGYYPAFDVTPPELITGIGTDRGVLAPGELRKYFDSID